MDSNGIKGNVKGNKFSLFLSIESIGVVTNIEIILNLLLLVLNPSLNKALFNN